MLQAAKILSRLSRSDAGDAHRMRRYRAVESGRINAVVYDSPILQYYVAHEGSGSLRLVGSIFRKESYGILFSPNDPRRKLINEVLLRLRETGEYDMIYQKWFGKALEDARAFDG